MTTTEITHPCPQCNQSIPVCPGYVTWCNKCNWNLVPTEKKQPRNFFESLYHKIGLRQSKKLYELITKSETPKPTFNIYTGLAFFFALLVHCGTLAFIILGIVLLSGRIPLLFSLHLLLGLLCLGVVWVIRPKFPKLPSSTVPRSQTPTIYAVVDKIADVMNAPKVDHVVFNDQYNASWTTCTWRQKRVLTIGLPLWSLLNHQERVAVIAHEIAHSINGDPGRGLFIGSAVNSLITWEWLLTPAQGNLSSGGFVTFISNIFAKIVMTILSIVPSIFAYILAHLLWQDSQRAEYLADYLAATTGGSAATISALEKLQIAFHYPIAMKKMQTESEQIDTFEPLHQFMTAIPAYERERLNRADNYLGERLNATHPPTPYRVAFLTQHSDLFPKITISPIEADQITKELEPLRNKIVLRR